MTIGADASVVDDVGDVVTVKLDRTRSKRFLLFFFREKESLEERNRINTLQTVNRCRLSGFDKKVAFSFDLLGEEVVHVWSGNHIGRHGRFDGRHPSPLVKIHDALPEFKSILRLNCECWTWFQIRS